MKLIGKEIFFGVLNGKMSSPYSNFKLDELRAELKKRNLKAQGNKPELIERLDRSDKGITESTDVPGQRGRKPKGTTPPSLTPVNMVTVQTIQPVINSSPPNSPDDLDQIGQTIDKMTIATLKKHITNMNKILVENGSPAEKLTGKKEDLQIRLHGLVTKIKQIKNGTLPKIEEKQVQTAQPLTTLQPVSNPLNLSSVFNLGSNNPLRSSSNFPSLGRNFNLLQSAPAITNLFKSERKEGILVTSHNINWDLIFISVSEDFIEDGLTFEQINVIYCSFNKMETGNSDATIKDCLFKLKNLVGPNLICIPGGSFIDVFLSIITKDTIKYMVKEKDFLISNLSTFTVDAKNILYLVLTSP